jgi:hypothetical protein
MWNMTLMPLSPGQNFAELVVQVLAVIAGAAVYKEA